MKQLHLQNLLFNSDVLSLIYKLQACIFFFNIQHVFIAKVCIDNSEST